MTLEDRLERLANRTPPGDPADILAAARSRVDTSSAPLRARSRLLAAAAVIAVIVLGAAALAFSGDDRDSVTAAGPDGGGSLDGRWTMTATLTDNEIRVTQARASVTVDGNTVVGDDGCGNGMQAMLDDGTVAWDGRRTLIGCVDGPASDDADRFWHVIEQQPRAERRGGEMWLVAADGDALVFHRPDAAAETTESVTAEDGEPVRVLPGWVPDGFRLAWVDTPAERPSGSSTGPLAERPHDYAFGYQKAGAAELEVRVIVGASIDDPQAVADEWDSLAAPTTVGGRPAVGYTDEGRYTRLLVEIDGGIAMITTHPLGESYPDGLNPAMPAREDVDRFAASIDAVSDADWEAALSSSGADVASMFGPKDGAAVVDGDGWSLVHGEVRAPLSVRHPALWLDFGEATGGAAGSGVLGEIDAWHVAISVHDSTRVAWGILPAGAETVEVTIDGQVFSVETVALADTAQRAFAVDVSRSTGNGTFQATGATGNQVASGPIDTE